ncbi:MAG: hypothetical protein ACI9S8_001039 [Chlamydiales bacterium]|jgi:hypothetical protein
MSVPVSSEAGNFTVKSLGCGVEVLVDRSNEAKVAYLKPWGQQTEWWGRKILAPMVGLGAILAGALGWLLTRGDSIRTRESGSIGYLAAVTGLALTAMYKRYYNSDEVDFVEGIKEKRVQLLQGRSGNIDGSLSDFLTPSERAKMVASATKVRDLVVGMELDLGKAKELGVINGSQVEAYQAIVESYQKLDKELQTAKKPVLEGYAGQIHRASMEKELTARRAKEDFTNSPCVRALEDHKKEYNRSVGDILRQEIRKFRDISGVSAEREESLEASRKRLSAEAKVLKQAASLSYYQNIIELEPQRMGLEKVFDAAKMEAEEVYLRKRLSVKAEFDAKIQEIELDYAPREEELDKLLKDASEALDDSETDFQPKNYTLHSSIKNADLRTWVEEQIVQLDNN